MNATEARKKRSSSTLVERTRRDRNRATRIGRLVTEASIEHTLQQIMEIEDVSAAELAKRVKSKPPQISRDLHGGLSKARVSRLATLAGALGYDFIPMFIPRDDLEKRRALLDVTRDVLFKPHTRKRSRQEKASA